MLPFSKISFIALSKSPDSKENPNRLSSFGWSSSSGEIIDVLIFILIPISKSWHFGKSSNHSISRHVSIFTMALCLIASINVSLDFKGPLYII